MTTERDPTTLAAYLDAALVLQGLSIDPSWHAGILAHLTAIEAAARSVLAVPLDDEVEAAPIFTP